MFGRENIASESINGGFWQCQDRDQRQLVSLWQIPGPCVHQECTCGQRTASRVSAGEVVRYLTLVVSRG